MQARMRVAAKKPKRVYRGCFDRIDLLGNFHRRQFRSNASANAAAHYQTGDNRPGLVDDGKHDRRGQQRFSSKSGQAVPGFQRKHNTGGRARHRNQRERLRSDLVELMKQFPELEREESPLPAVPARKRYPGRRTIPEIL